MDHRSGRRHTPTGAANQKPPSFCRAVDNGCWRPLARACCENMFSTTTLGWAVEAGYQDLTRTSTSSVGIYAQVCGSYPGTCLFGFACVFTYFSFFQRLKTVAINKLMIQLNTFALRTYMPFLPQHRNLQQTFCFVDHVCDYECSWKRCDGQREKSEQERKKKNPNLTLHR